jgi:DUF1365 family protein
VTPIGHDFTYGVSYVWLDPDAPDELCRHHPLWSARRPAPARFRRSDYGDASGRSLVTQVRDDLTERLGYRPQGPVRMLTQVRRWGWLFNPITLFVAWDDTPERAVGAVLEVTNTPWKERRRYAVALGSDPADERGGLSARVAKALHVSPFLDEAFEYVIRLRDAGGDVAGLELAIDVVRPGSSQPVLMTRLQLDRVVADRRSLGRSLATRVAPTHRVSAGIHAQAARLWVKRVPFVPHPRSKKVPS